MHPSRRHLLLSLFAGALPWPALSSPASAAASTAAAPAPALPLLGLWPGARDPAGYLVSEKFDGVRGLWDGTTLRFRSGRVVAAPAWFTAALPPIALDGELWLGRGRFDALSGSVRKALPVDAEWREVRYLVFDLPGAAGSFAERSQRLAAIVRASACPALVAVEHTPVTDAAALQRRLAAVTAQGGEGLVLHLASAPYRTGRSDTLLKLKTHLDSEATVLAHRPGKGKYEGRVGALDVCTPEGRRFLVGSGLSDALRREPPPIGSVITYRYRDLTRTGLPRFASYLRMASV